MDDITVVEMLDFLKRLEHDSGEAPMPFNKAVRLVRLELAEFIRNEKGQKEIMGGAYVPPSRRFAGFCRGH